MELASPQLVTAADLERLSKEERVELIAGKLVPMWDLSYERGLRTATLSCLVALFVKENRLGRCVAANTGFLLGRDPDTVLSVSFAFTKTERMPPRPVWGWSNVVPDLVLLTRAPSTTDQETQERVTLWLKAGAQIVWELDLNRRCLKAHRTGQASQVVNENEILACEDLLPRFSLPLREVFED